MKDNIKYSLYKDSNEVDASIIRSLLLFDKEGIKAPDMVEKAVFAIILERDGNLDVSKLVRIFNDRFQESFSAQDIRIHLTSLQNRGFISSDLRVSPNFDRDYFEEIELLTSNFFDRIIARVNKIVPVSSSDYELIKRQIRKALSVYFKMYGFEFFDIQEHSREEEAKNAIRIAKEGLREELGEALVRTLALVIQEQSDEDKIVLRTWAKAFVATQVMKMDPTLKLFKAEQLKNKQFLLDTDVVLHCITKNTLESVPYRKMLDRLRAIRASLFVDERVVKEVQNHADAALKIYNRYGEAIREFPNEVLRGEISNVFIDDYVQLIRKNPEKSSMTFHTYLGNHYNKTDSGVLFDCLNEVFGEKILQSKISADVNEEDDSFKRLSDKIFEYTSATYKGSFRSDELNREMSNLDAYLYMAARKSNEGITRPKSLSGSTYVVTTSTRALRSARDIGFSNVDVVCHPNAIIAYLDGTGDFVDDDGVEIINLFENPFLTYLANSMWDDIQALLNKGVILRFKELRQLRSDVNREVHNIITSSVSEEDKKRQLRERKFYFVEDIEHLQQQVKEKNGRIEALEKSNRAKDKRIQELQTRKAKTGTKSISQSRKKRKP